MVVRRLAIAAVVVASLAGCDDTDRPNAGPVPAPSATPTAKGTATPKPAARTQVRKSKSPRAVVANWVDAVARGDVSSASSYFSLPATISQGRSFRITTQSELRLFNASLPCGAKLTAWRREGTYSVGTFRLFERSGHACPDTGQTAEVAFRFRRGRISEWRQLVERVRPGDGGSSGEA